MRLPIKQMFDGVTREIVTVKPYPESIAIMSRYANENDAKFIVKACNSHNDLLETCKELLKAYHDNNYAWPLPLTNTSVFDRAKEAIKKATE